MSFGSRCNKATAYSFRRAAKVSRVVVTVGALACSSELSTLGREEPDFGIIGEPRQVLELASEGRNENPTLTGDGLEVFFNSTRPGGPGNMSVWTARRASVDEPFGPPELAREASHEGSDTSVAIDADGLSLWVGTTREGSLGGRDIWVTRRATRDANWTELQQVPELSSPDHDIPRPPGQGGTVMPLSSFRGGAGVYQIYFARRTAPGAPWSAPEARPDLEVSGVNVADAQLSEDGRQIFMNRDGDDAPSDIYRAWRRSTDEPFGPAVPVDELNTGADDRDPFISRAAGRIYFASDRDGEMMIYEAELLTR